MFFLLKKIILSIRQSGDVLEAPWRAQTAKLEVSFVKFANFMEQFQKVRIPIVGLQQEISEVMYRQVNSKTAEAIAAAFCPKILEPLAPTPKKKKSGKEQKETKQKQKKRKNKEQKDQKEPASPNFQVFITLSRMRTTHLCIATH